MHVTLGASGGVSVSVFFFSGSVCVSVECEGITWEGVELWRCISKYSHFMWVDLCWSYNTAMIQMTMQTHDSILLQDVKALKLFNHTATSREAFYSALVSSQFCLAFKWLPIMFLNYNCKCIGLLKATLTTKTTGHIFHLLTDWHKKGLLASSGSFTYSADT